ncbi:MAG: exonuclease, partial [Duncaniella sp.]|nr:exonuclease [Duncaniella sp.]
GMDYSYPQFFCTLEKSRRTFPRSVVGSFSLPNLCEFMGIPFNNHHNALADAEACAKIAMTIL